MREALELTAVLASTLFAGASIYINLVAHPARLSCGTELAARQWAPSYKRATVMQVSPGHPGDTDRDRARVRR